MSRIYLSPPHVEPEARQWLLDAFDSNWLAPLGPHVDAFEKEIAAHAEVRQAAALASGTAGLHLALLLLNVGPGDEVIVSDSTFVASANVVRYVGAVPVFVDSDESSWTIDPDLLAEALEARSRVGARPKAVIAVDLYGQCADYDRILEVCGRFDVPVIQDASESLGARYRGAPAGGQGAIGVYSFNGNKIITTSGGGMLVSNHEAWVEKARSLASQARDPAPHYEHSEVGYNYRLSNLLAAVGRAQLKVLERRVADRRRNFERYVAGLASLPGLDFMPEASYGLSTRWLTCATIGPESRADREDIRLALARADIEARPVWKPMHLQPLYKDCRIFGGSVGRRLFERGICLPSGSTLTDAELDRIIGIVRRCNGEPS